MKNLYLILVFSCLFIVGYAQTNVSGGIYSNTTWTKANSPYIVTDTVVVFPNVTLTIEPGVVMKFNDAVFLDIRGGINAVGTALDSITFTSSSLFPHKGIWAGLLMRANSNLDDAFNYCNFSYADIAIDVEFYTGKVVSVRHTNFDNNNSGAVGYNDMGAGLPIFLLPPSYVIDSCAFRNNTRGIGRVGGGSSMKLSNSIFENNDYGIDWASMDSGVVNTVFSCNRIAISVESGVFSNCTITNNGVGSLPSFFNNYITFTSCVFARNDTGIVLHSQGPNNHTYFNSNTICSNGKNVVHTGSYNVNMENTCWCDVNSQNIANTIQDAFDNVSLGIIDYTPWSVCDSTAISQVVNTPCNSNPCQLFVSTIVTDATCDTCHTGTATASVSFGSAPITYTWNTSPIQNTQTATGLAPGYYTVCVIDANGCTACKSVSVDSNNCSGLSLSLHPTNATCSSCNDGSAQINVSGGTMPYTYTWYTAPMQNTLVAGGLSQGIYVGCASDANGCTICDSVIVGIGNCSAHFNLYPDTIPHNYFAVNMASGSGTLSYLWNWGDGTTSVGAYPNHTYASPGQYNICLTITDSVGCSNTFCNGFYLMRTENTMIQVNVVPGINTGIPTVTQQQFSFRIFPNPASNFVTMIIDEILTGGTLTITDLTGRVVAKTQLVTSNTQLSTEDLPNGLYFVTVYNKGAVSSRKLVIQH